MQQSVHWPLGFIASCLILAPSSVAQTPSPCASVASGLMIYASYNNTHANPPFSATIQTTTERTLADGNAIHGLIVTHEYRDSAGRLRVESSQLCQIGFDGQLHPVIAVMVDDPVGHTHTSWQVNGTGPKVVRVVHQSGEQSAPPAQPTPPTDEQTKLRALTQARWNKNTRHEQLGTRSIAGMLADGTRQITTTPAGEQGNEKPIDFTEDFWTAHDLGIVVLQVQDDPRSGRYTQEVKELTLAEPDPSVFAPPPDYKIEEQPAKALTP